MTLLVSALYDLKMNHRCIYRILFFSICTSVPFLSTAQSRESSSLRQLTIHNKKDSFFLSALTILPSTIELSEGENHPVPASSYWIKGAYFYWSESAPQVQANDSVSYRIRFRVMPYQINQWQSRFDSLLYRDGSMHVMEPLSYGLDNGQDPIFAEQGIKYDGSFARGLSLGNRQDLVLNSNFDLRLSGRLGDGIEVLAALSDNSIPLQPDGNTQQLQEFDKIFIKLSKGGNSLVGGDFELMRPQSYFTNYFKKTQGVRVVNHQLLSKDRSLTSAASAGGSRGKFARIQLETREGNQGPYRLRGTEGERFIIILAGTEKIYHDGILLIRGLEKDYIIDYNSGELTFTANRIITKDSRVIAEYEYSDQNYNRSVLTFETDYKTRKVNLHFNAYSEQDGKLSTGLSDLTTEDKRFLATVGDSTANAQSSTIRLRPEGYDPNVVMYKLIDTLGYEGVLVRSTDPDSAQYTARFTRVGTGNGNYIRIASEDNGEVYAWIAPDSIMGSRGNYAPLTTLIAPQQKQMFAFGGRYSIGADGYVKSEVALSRLDRNRFSTRDAADDYGYAVRNEFSKSFSLQKEKNENSWLVNTQVAHEQLTNSFERLNPYRNAEFDRDWNVTGLKKDKETLVNSTLSLEKPGIFTLAYRYGNFSRSSLYRGHKNVYSLKYSQRGFNFYAISDALNTTNAGQKSKFYRPKIDISQSLDKKKSWIIGFYFEEEKNERRSLLSDTLTQSSFYYDLGRLYLRRTGGKRFNIDISYQKRFDYFATGKDFNLGTEADDVSLKVRWVENTKSVLDATFTFRDLHIKDKTKTPEEGGLNYVGKINHQFNLWKGAFRTATAYEIGSGQEPRRTFQYLKVDPGQGVYTHIDINKDGIQQINEFEIAPFAEQAQYVRVTILTNDFIATNNVNFNQSFSITPRRLLKNKKSFWAKWSDQGSLRINRKNLQNSQVSIWSPFTINIVDSSLVSVGAQIRNVLYFNRNNPKYDFQYEWNDFRNRFVLTTGYESKLIKRNILRSRINLNQEFSGLISITHEDNIQDSETFDNKDFEIRSFELKPELTWQPMPKFRLAAKYRWADKNNQMTEGQNAGIHDLEIEGTLSKISTSSFRGHFALVLIDYSGPKNGSLEFAMLEGLKDGTNWLWGLAYDRRLANNIRINISYDGRQSGQAKVVHTARAQVSAFF